MTNDGTGFKFSGVAMMVFGGAAVAFTGAMAAAFPLPDHARALSLVSGSIVALLGGEFLIGGVLLGRLSRAVVYVHGRPDEERAGMSHPGAEDAGAIVELSERCHDLEADLASVRMWQKQIHEDLTGRLNGKVRPLRPAAPEQQS